MRISQIDIIEAVIPFDDGGSGMGITPGRWDALEMVLVRIETDTGLVGWGDCFAYSCRSAVAAAAKTMVAPLLEGRELPATPEALTLEIQRRLHIFGRYGIAMFAISGFDIALWDIAAQSQCQPLHALLGTVRRKEVPAYASLVRYGDPALVQHYCRAACDQGYRSIKLHEIEPDIIRAGRAAVGPDIGLSVDVNCAWSAAQTQDRIALLQEVNALWIEEPVFPPEDIRTQARINSMFPVGAGENACTRHEFARMLEADAVRYAQPSVIKVGGVTEFVAVAALAEAKQVAVMPHSPYFGPGYFTTLHLSAVLAGDSLFEHLYVQPAADLAQGGTPLPKQGVVRVPEVPGHGFVPDEKVLARWRVGD